MELEELPGAILVEILDRLHDTGDLARCRLASRIFRSLSLHVRSVRLLCSPRETSRAQRFKTLVTNIASLLQGSLESVSITVLRPSEEDSDREFDDADDLHLTADKFLVAWLPAVGGRLRLLAISDYWMQSCWRKTDAFGVISNLCGNLLKLEIKNAWLSVERLEPMSQLTTLTLEFVRLDDEMLDKMNESFPSLQVLNLIGVGGLCKPKIQLPKLRACHWTVSSCPHSLSVCAPKLDLLKLTCVEPKILVLETPLLSNLDLKIRKASGTFKVETLLHLKSLRVETADLRGLLQVFMNSRSVKNLELEVPVSAKQVDLQEILAFGDMVSAFPNVDDLKLGRGAWDQLQKSTLPEFLTDWQKLRRLKVFLPELEFDTSFLFSLLNQCVPHCEVMIQIPGKAPAVARNHLVSTCTFKFSKFRWKWETWNESPEDDDASSDL